MSTERLFVGQSFTPQLRGVNLVPPATPKIVSRSEGTDAEIAALLDAHYAGTVNLHEIWNIGDTRTVHLSAMPATGVGESHVEQDVEFQIVNAGGKELADGTECAFIVQLKDVLNEGVSLMNSKEKGYMNSTSTNIGGWKECARRIWCNNVFRAALPEATRNFFKLHKNKTSQGNQLTTLDETEDYFALPCIVNLYGQSQYIVNEDTVQWNYYSGSSAKGYKGTGWWLRSPCESDSNRFYLISGGGGYSQTKTSNANSELAIVPFGTI